MVKNNMVAHELIAKICVDLACRIYEDCASRHNLWYKMNPDRKEFVMQCAPTLRIDARRIAAQMILAAPTLQEQEAIYEAILLDATIPLSSQASNVPRLN
jgi:hypothetical protein